MTPEEFDVAAARTQQKPRTKAAARAVLVDGLGPTQAGRNCVPPMSRAQVDDAVSRIEREHRALIGAPRGWRCITLTLPWYGEEWDAAEALQRAAYERMKSGSTLSPPLSTDD